MNQRKDSYQKRCPHCGNYYSTRGYGAYRKHVEACSRKTQIKKLKERIAHWEKKQNEWITAQRFYLAISAEIQIEALKKALKVIT